MFAQQKSNIVSVSFIMCYRRLAFVKDQDPGVFAVIVKNTLC